MLAITWSKYPEPPMFDYWAEERKEWESQKGEPALMGLMASTTRDTFRQFRQYFSSYLLSS